MTASRRGALLALAPSAFLFALLVWWSADGGGYDPTVWYPGALLVLGLLVMLVVAGSRPRISRAGWIALGSFAAYVAWSYLSIAWAQSPGEALEGANRTLTYLMIFAVALAIPWEERWAFAALAILSIGLGLVDVVTLGRLTSGHAHRMFLDARLASPTGYQNANAALAMMGALLGMGLGARREVPWWVRGPLLAGAGAGLMVAVLSQSRGWLYTLVPVVVLGLLLVRNRVRTILFSLLPIAATAAVVGPLIRVFDRGGFHGHQHSFAYFWSATDRAADQAGRAALIATAVLLVVALIAAALDRRVTPSAGVVRAARTGGRIVAAACAILAVVGVFVVSHGNPFHEADHAWHRFKSSTQPHGESRFTSVGGSRYDFWRVAVKATGEHPLLGLGQDNYATAYYRLRHSGEEPRWAHSLELRLLVSTGIVGFLIFVTSLVATFWAAARHRTAAAGIAALPSLVWLLHGSVDWLWEFPALSGIAFTGLGMAAALNRARADEAREEQRKQVEGDEPAPASPPSAPPAPRAGRLALGAGAAVLALAAALVLVFPWLAARELNNASADSGSDPRGALQELDRAADLNPLSAAADYRAAGIAINLGDIPLAAGHLQSAADRDPDGWLAPFELGLIDGVAGRRAAARARLERARSLNPREPLIHEALRRLDTRGPLTARAANAELARRVKNRTDQQG